MRQIHDTSLVFIHIPKTAGMAVVNAFGLEHQTLDHSIFSPTDLQLLDSRFVRFTVFRNPVTRFESAYKYSLSMLQAYRGNSVREDILNHGLDKDVNLFLSFYQDKRQRLLSNRHFIPQGYYYLKCKPSIVLRQEQLATDIDIVARLAPQHFVGLAEKNKSPSHADVNTTLNEKSVETVNQLYQNDFLLWNM
jgi:hypothetical protein